MQCGGDGTLPLTTLSQALIVAFKEAFPLARIQHKGSPQSLDATRIQLDDAYLEGADLKQAWMPDASPRGANFWGVDLSSADLSSTNLRGANLSDANLSRVDLNRRGSIGGSNSNSADLSNANPEDAQTLDCTDLREVMGLTKEQLEVCKAKGAIIDEDPTTNTSQSTVAPALLPQCNDTQARSGPFAQGNVPTSDTDDSSTITTRLDPEL